MEKQFLGPLLLLLLLLGQLTLASETSGQDDQQTGQSTSSGTSHNSVLQTGSTGVNTTLSTASTVITTIGRTTWVTADTQEGRITTTLPSIVVNATRQDPAPSMNSTFKNQIVTTQSTPPQPMEAANTTERGITDEDIKSETKATLITTADENTNSLTTKMASDMVNGMIKATPTASSTIATIGKNLTQPTATTSSLFKNPGGTFPTVPITSTTAASTAKATQSMIAPMSETPGGTPVGILSHYVWKTTHAGTNEPMKTIMSEANPVSRTLATITTTRKDIIPSTTKKSSKLRITSATPMISMTVTEALKGTVDITPTYPKETTTNAGTILNMMTMSETKATITVPATVDSRKKMISSVATISSRSKSQGGSTTQAITGSMELTAHAGKDTMHMESPKTITLPSVLSTGTNTSPFMSMASRSLPAMSSPCASDEYPRTTGEGGCMCNSNHYNHLDLNNVPVVLSCQPWEIEVSLSQCFLETHGWVQGNDLFPGCTGISKIIHGWRAITFVLKKNESKCGLSLSTNSSHALYSLNAQLPPGLKTSNDSININFSCAYPLVVNVSQKVFSKEATHLLNNIYTTGTGDTIITMSIFSDAQFSILLGNESAILQRPLFVALEAINADPNQFVLVVNTFFASTNDSGASAPQTTYYFVKHGCPVSSRLLTESNTNGISLKVKLAFYPFRFFTSDVLYYHSQVMLCDKKRNSSCQPTCSKMNPKWKLELDHQNKNNSGWLTYGPVRFQGSDPSHNRAPSGPMSVTFLLLVVINWILV